MPSKLFEAARAATKNVDALDKAMDWLRSCHHPAPAFGRRVRENVEIESHFGSHFGDATVYSEFLEYWLGEHSAHSEDQDRIGGFERACDQFSGRGLPIIPALIPESLIRYTMSRQLAAIFIEYELGKSARMDFESGLLSPEDAFRLVALNWNGAHGLTGAQLSRSRVVFATFEHTGDAPRLDATAMADALALPGRFFGAKSDDILFELTYQSSSVSDSCFPTVADVGWSCVFKPSPEVLPDESDVTTCFGWTEPFNGQPSQPELVHRNCSLSALTKPPRLLGRVR
jgi:hypothetical protein